MEFKIRHQINYIIIIVEVRLLLAVDISLYKENNKLLILWDKILQYLSILILLLINIPAMIYKKNNNNWSII